MPPIRASRQFDKNNLPIFRDGKCDFCGRAVKRNRDQRNHALGHLPDDDPDAVAMKRRYPCPYCDKKFTQKHAMQVHAKKHNNIKDCQCPKCPFATGDPSSLARHQKRFNHYKTPEEDEEDKDQDEQPLKDDEPEDEDEQPQPEDQQPRADDEQPQADNLRPKAEDQKAESDSKKTSEQDAIPVPLFTAQQAPPVVRIEPFIDLRMFDGSLGTMQGSYQPEWDLFFAALLSRTPSMTSFTFASPADLAWIPPFASPSMPSVGWAAEQSCFAAVPQPIFPESPPPQLQACAYAQAAPSFPSYGRVWQCQAANDAFTNASWSPAQQQTFDPSFNSASMPSQVQDYPSMYHNDQSYPAFAPQEPTYYDNNQIQDPLYHDNAHMSTGYEEPTYYNDAQMWSNTEDPAYYNNAPMASSYEGLPCGNAFIAPSSTHLAYPLAAY
ncbi:hypothetical protein HDZ31DRAFT_72901 [Schizophyllum fasciatum]